MEEKKDTIPPEIKVVIAAALARYLRDEKFSFKVVSIKPVQLSQINLWGLEGRRLNMTRVKG
ncbi:MAG: hypothetical protein NUV68_00360 [Caldiserica bacterium]|jgi:hypothetical protein|nr:hypothetical protein [Caldisericota bacterium]MDH7561813.1 hypothetical protein [Caldisericota bacterium]